MHGKKSESTLMDLPSSFGRGSNFPKFSAIFLYFNQKSLKKFFLQDDENFVTVYLIFTRKAKLDPELLKF